ncbi:uncharacterized protein PAC_19471 [Phialocephala subalpina]|uniref:Uncharacterized protein n=1 Tax=Phialocephala subalpina TaxID=576137 RepID=A0A1L7XWY9_9HELO|nr:uncharacterized protein PAC_19471 [Phialocephala subalpina]
MSGVGEAAAVLELVKLCGTVVNSCYKYAQSARNAPVEIQRAICEIDSLKGILERLHSLTLDASSALGSQMGPNGPFQACMVALEELAKRLMVLNDASAVRRRLLWPVESGKVQEILAGLEKHKSSLMLAILASGGENEETNLRVIAETKMSVEELKAMEKRKDVLRWLKDVDPTSNHRVARKKHEQPETGSWLLQCEELKAWQDHGAEILWMHGNVQPLISESSIVIEYLSSLPTNGATTRTAYFYFDFNDKSKQSTFNCLRSLAHQLIEQSDTVHEDILDVFDKYKGSSSSLSQELVIDILALLLSCPKKTFLIIDALDECMEDERKEFLTALSTIKDIASGNFGIFITSRPEPDIRRGMEGLKVKELAIQPAHVDEDVRTYVEACLQTDGTLKSWSPTLKKEIQNAITQGSNGMFRWAYCQLVLLKKCYKPAKIREVLSTLPDNLDGTYDRIFQQIAAGYEREIRAVLMLLAFSARPMSIEEVAEATAINLKSQKFDPEDRFLEPNIILKLCSSLVTLTTQKRRDSIGQMAVVKVLQFSHYTVKSYILSDRAKSRLRPEYCISPSVSHESITQMCLVYLLEFNGGEFTESFNHAEYPFLLYAAKNWTIHWSEIDKGEQDSVENLFNKLIESLFTRLFSPDKLDNFMNWLNIWDPASYRQANVFGRDADNPWSSYATKPVWAKSRSKEDFAQPLYYACTYGLLGIASWIVRHHSGLIPLKDDLDQALEAAAGGGYDEIVRFLLDEGADPNSNQRTKWGSPLHAAVSSGKLSTISLLLDAGADIDFNASGDDYVFTDGKWGTALHTATKNGSIPGVELLLSRGANRNICVFPFGTPLTVAAKVGNDDLVGILLRSGANPRALGGSSTCPLLAACNDASLEVVKLLLENGADPNGEIPPNESALYVASERGDLNIMRLLLEKGANVNARGGTYGSPIQASIQSRNEAAFELLLHAGADINYQGGYAGSVVGQAIFSYQLSTLNKLLDRGAKFGDYALIEAIDMDLPEVVNILLTRGADPNAEHKEHGNVLQQAVGKGNDQIVKLLLEAGAEVSVIEGEEGTSLQVACIHKREKIVRLLLDFGAQTDMPPCGKYGSILEAALSQSDNDVVVHLILEKSPDVNACGGRLGTPLQAAAARGRQDFVEGLLQRGADLDAKGGDYGTALRAAISNEHETLVKYLLNSGADPNILVTGAHTPRSEGGSITEHCTALEVAAASGKIELVQLLLDHGARINEVGTKDMQPSILDKAVNTEGMAMMHYLFEQGADARLDKGAAVHAAVHQHDIPKLKLLIEHGADINRDCGWHGSVLQSAISDKQYDTARFLLSAGANINFQGGHHGTPLESAIHDVFGPGNSDFVLELLEHGADVNRPSGHWGTPLAAAASIGDEKILHALLDHGADINQRGGEFGTALLTAIWRDHFVIAHELLDRGADIHASGFVVSALVAACGYFRPGQLKLVERILDLGADIEAHGEDEGENNWRSFSALQMAAYVGNEKVVQLLLERGANIHSGGRKYGNPLAAASFKGHIGIVKMLIEKGADVNAIGGKYGTALQAALDEVQPSVIEFLLSSGADVNLEGGYYGTPLQVAARNGNIKRMQVLLDHGAKVNTKIGHFGNPLQAAAKKGHLEAVRFLLEQGANVHLVGGKYYAALQAAACARHDSYNYEDKSLDILELLIEKGADVNAQGGKYGTALQAAAYHCAKFTKCLLKHGADPNSGGGKFGSPLKAARAKGLGRVIRMLLKHGAEDK